MLDLFEKHKEIIKEFHVISYDQEISSVRIKIDVTFIDDSKLFIKEYFFKNAERKYSYHWTDATGNVLCRWDNAPHWENMTTFPHHKHIRTDVMDSRETTLAEVLLVIDDKLTPS